MIASTLVEILRHRADHLGDRLAYAYLEHGAVETEHLTYGSLDRRARAIAARIQSTCTPGDRALLLYPAGLEFLAAFFGCLYAGVIAIPAPPPEASRLKRTGPRLRAIAADAKTSIVLTTTSIHSLIENSDTTVFEGPKEHWLETDQVASDLAGFWRQPVIDDSHLAYLQYTSGSTSAPRGVMIGHRQLASHLANLQRMCGYTADSLSVTWMPYFHDYGLVEGLLEPLHNATPCYVMSPFAFIKRPFSWLQALSFYRATHSQAPNFAFDLCTRRVNAFERTELDLSNWRSAGCAAEPINPRVLTAFHEAFSSAGFQWRAFCPAYGLAEATLLVSTCRQDEDPVLLAVDAAALENNRVLPAADDRTGSRTVVGCGRIFESTKVAIVRQDTLTRCAPDEVGEIWVADDSVAEGYWGRESDTRETFQAYLADTGDGPFLRTGDLGFIKDGELVITGRHKDVIIIRGANHYPQDIEWTVQVAHPALRPDGGAAFSVLLDGEEKLAVAHEVERDHVPALDTPCVIQSIRQAVSETHELDVFAVILLKRGSIPKTASSKTQRHACRKFYLHGGPEVLAGWVAPTRKLDLVPGWLTTGKQGGVTAPAEATAPLPNGKADSVQSDSKAEASRRKAGELVGWLREYAAERINSRLMDERRCVPPYIVLDFGNRGIMGLQVPQTHAGLGLGLADSLRVLEQVAAVDVNLAAVVFLHNTNGIRPIQYHARPSLRDELLPILASGRELASFALSEPIAGSNLAGIASVALPQAGGGWRLRGLKRWNASSWAGVVSVFARLVGANGKPGGLTGFAVRQGTPGIRIGPEALTMGLRGSMQNSLILSDVPVSPEHLLGEPGKGMAVVDDALSVGRVCTAAVCLGVLKRCAQLMVRYAGRRTVATGRLLENPITLAKLSTLTALITCNETLLYKIAALLDAGATVPLEIMMAVKISTSEAAVWATGELVQMLGGRGYMENNIAPQLLRDTRALTIGEGPTETLALSIGRAVIQSDVIARFLLDALNAPDLARQFKDDAHRIHEHCATGSGSYSNRSTAVSWACWLVGKVACEALLLASVQAAAGRGLDGRLARAREHMRLRYEQGVRDAIDASVGRSRFLTPLETVETIAGYAETIGDVEQNLPGEEQALDSLLRHAIVAVPGDAAVGLPGDLTTVEGEIGEDETRFRPSQQPDAMLTPESKRARLEQLLRKQISESDPAQPRQDVNHTNLSS